MNEYAIEPESVISKAPAPIPKHKDLFNAVQQINGVTRQAGKLLDEIRGANSIDTPTQKDVVAAPMPPTPPLSEILSTTPDVIRKKCIELTEILHSIRSELF